MVTGGDDSSKVQYNACVSTRNGPRLFFFYLPAFGVVPDLDECKQDFRNVCKAKCDQGPNIQRNERVLSRTE